jgi:hypothetical protein
MAFIWYIYIQNNKLIYDKWFLDPVCKFIIWDTPIPENTTFCSSLSYTESYYTDELENIKLEYSQNIFSMLIWIYESENFSKTKEVSFLLNKTETKLKTLDIIEKFDKLKLDFLWIEKRRVQCNNLMIDSNTSILTMDCESYSKWYESNIIWFSWNKTDSTIGWTSISVANSFLNFIEKNSVDFELINRQKIFDTVNTVWEKSGYTMKTPFDISLKINF